MVDKAVSNLRLVSALDRAQWLSLCAIVLFAPHTYRQVVWTISPPRLNVFLEFQGVVLFLSDYLLALLVVITLLRLRFDRAYAAQFSETIQVFFRQSGGALWLAWLIWMD